MSQCESAVLLALTLHRAFRREEMAGAFSRAHGQLHGSREKAGRLVPTNSGCPSIRTLGCKPLTRVSFSERPLTGEGTADPELLPSLPMCVEMGPAMLRKQCSLTPSVQGVGDPTPAFSV